MDNKKNIDKKNPLLENILDSDYIIPFDRIKVEHFIPAMTHYLELAQSCLQEITESEAEPTFHSVVEKLEFIDRELYQVSSIFFGLNLVNKTEEIESISSEMTDLSTSWDQHCDYNRKLFEKVKSVFLNKRDHLSPIESKLLDNTYQKFLKNGAALDDSLQNRIKKIDEKLDKLELKFTNHVLKDTNDNGILATIDEIQGLGSLEVNQAHQEAKKKHLDGYYFNYNYWDHILDYSENRELRKKAFELHRQIGHRKNKNNNDLIISDIVQLRKEKANILGYDNFSSFTLDGRMAKNLPSVYSLIDKVYEKAEVKSIKDLQALTLLAQKIDGLNTLEPWDINYYKNLELKQRLDLNPMELAQYFPIQKVWTGLQKLIFEIYQVQFKEIQYPIYNDKVSVFEVKDNCDQKLGTLFLDLYNRPTKQTGAFMDSFVEPGLDRKQTVLVACNFNDLGQCLLTWEEVKTLFHEMGHALHSLLSKAYYPTQAGTSVDWDFVELPSQFMENWAEEPQVLEWISGHAETGQTLPIEMMNKLSIMNNFCNGFSFINQIILTKLDFAFHTAQEDILDIESFEKNIYDEYSLFPYIKGTSRSTSFLHVFEGDYASSYYSYLWANVLDRDAFFQCKKTGLFQSPYLVRFKSLLEKGSTIDELTNYKEFKGSDPEIDAFLMSNDLE
jgi:peptidyl-dipeptidase Dcp